MSDRDTVIFDLGGVLIEWDPRRVYREVFDGDEERVDWFLSTICTPEWNHRQDAGRSLAEATEERVARFPEHEALIRAYYGRWEEMLGGAIEESVGILHDVKQAGHPVYALTNWSAETFPVARSRFDFLTWFDGIVVSGEVRMAKPDAAIYHHLLAEHGIMADDAVYIDDSLRNVEAAEELGFHGIHFQSPAQLRTELEDLGFLTP